MAIESQVLLAWEPNYVIRRVSKVLSWVGYVLIKSTTAIWGEGRFFFVLKLWMHSKSNSNALAKSHMSSKGGMFFKFNNGSYDRHNIFMF